MEQPVINVLLTCITHEESLLLDSIMAEYRKHYDVMEKRGLPLPASPDSAYGSFYWLVRYSGLVQPIQKINR